MANLKINTDAVATAAGNLKTINNQIKDDFPGVETAIKNLDSSWDGSAATAAISKFNEFKSKFIDARYKVIDNYVNFLLNQVGQGYTQTEETNKSLAEKFK